MYSPVRAHRRESSVIHGPNKYSAANGVASAEEEEVEEEEEEEDENDEEEIDEVGNAEGITKLE